MLFHFFLDEKPKQIPIAIGTPLDSLFLNYKATNFTRSSMVGLHYGY